MKLRTLLAAIILAAFSASAIAEENEDGAKKEKPFPVYEGEIAADRVNIRSGPGTNHARLLKVNKGYQVTVTGRRDDWLRIQVPNECFLWIWRDYVSLDTETNIGKVTADKVNVRVEPKLGAEVVGQVDEGACVVVTGDEGGWYEIRPPSTAAAWVHSDLVQRVEPEK